MNVVQGSFKVMGSLNTELRAPHLKLSSEIPPSQELWLPRLPAGSSRQKDSGLKLCPTLRIKTVYLQLVSSSKFHSLLEAVCIPGPVVPLTFPNPRVLTPSSPKDPCDYTGPIRKVHGNLFIPRYWLNHIYRVLFTRLGNISSGDSDMDACKVLLFCLLQREVNKRKRKRGRELARIGITQQR